MALTDFTDEQTRALVNLRQRYEVWRDAERAMRALPYDLRRKSVGDYAYLYEIHDRSGNGTSLQRWDEAAAARLAAYREEKAAAKDRLTRSRVRLDEGARLVRALRVPLLATAPGPILREADCRGLLDGDLLVVGANALVAYQQEAVAKLALSDETEDFDLAWAGEDKPVGAPFWDMLKAVDATFTVNSEREFQARNADAYEVELLVAPCRDGSAARLVVPDPRWFALHKLWLGAQAKRDPLKRRKDLAQGAAVLDAVAEAMPHYPLDPDFVASIPPELEPFWREWQAQRAG